MDGIMSMERGAIAGGRAQFSCEPPALGPAPSNDPELPPPPAASLPLIIQGGMGVAVSSWKLAHAVSRLGQLGVVSGTALDQILARRLEDGDPGGHMERALRAFPFPAMAERVWQAHYIPGGKAEGASYRRLPMLERDGPRAFRERCIVANFCEIYLARAGHAQPVGINYLEKIQIPHLPSLYGAMLAGVGYVLMGAGIPARIPGALDLLAQHQAAEYPLHVTGAREGDEFTVRFDPREFSECALPPLRRPRFLAIVASNALAAGLLKKANGTVDGFIVEGPTAGGHNAPPRGKLQVNADGEPIYGDRDRVDLGQLRQLGLPFWLAGGYGSPEKLAEALAAGASGVQVGTPFAFCAESGIREVHKRAVLRAVRSGGAHVSTDAVASPTNFPFKVVQVADTISDPAVYRARPRICDLGYLREAYRGPAGELAFRCSAEPVSVYVSKGGRREETEGKKCLCNSLVATVGHAQTRNRRHLEPGLVTAGDSLTDLRRFLPSGGGAYTAADVIAALLAGSRSEMPLNSAGWPALSGEVGSQSAPAGEHPNSSQTAPIAVPAGGSIVAV